jgi:hypothetical protein
MVARLNRRSFTPTRILGYVALLAVVAYISATAFRVYTRKYYVFLPDYVRWVTTPRPSTMGRTTHVFFLFTDHFEPDYDADRVRQWGARYRALASRHHDSDGRPPQHTFFYPGEQGTPEIFETLRGLVESGFGEVELHYHHDFDTADTFRPKLEDAIHDFQRYGFLKTVDGQTRFAFIHGNWGLDNSNGPLRCGVNRELKLLRALGCFGDFTFPSIYEDSQPPFVDTIYAAKDDDQPKSYARQFPLTALDDGSADLMIFQGPLIFSPSLRPSRLFLDLDDSNIHMAMPASPTRVDHWIRANIHVANRPDWVFIKVHGHGISTASDIAAVLGPDFDRALTYLEQKYNDGRRYRLHYVTAREAYNLARAAADGAMGDPEQYFDCPIPPYVAHGPNRPEGHAGLKACAFESQAAESARYQR